MSSIQTRIRTAGDYVNLATRTLREGVLSYVKPDPHSKPAERAIGSLWDTVTNGLGFIPLSGLLPLLGLSAYAYTDARWAKEEGRSGIPINERMPHGPDVRKWMNATVQVVTTGTALALGGFVPAMIVGGIVSLPGLAKGIHEARGPHR